MDRKSSSEPKIAFDHGASFCSSAGDLVGVLADEALTNKEWGDRRSRQFHAIEASLTCLLFGGTLIWPTLVYKLVDEFITTGDTAMCLFLTEISVIAPRLLCLQMAVSYVTEALLYTKGRRCRTPPRAVALLMVMLIIHQFRAGFKHLCKSGGGDDLGVVIVRALLDLEVFVALLAFFAAIDAGHDVLHTLFKNIVTPINTSKPLAKWRAICRNFASFKNPEKDAFWSLDCAHASAHSVLLEISSAYLMMFKMVALLLFVLYLMDVDIYQNIVIVGTLSLVIAAMRSARLEESVSNLIPIAISNPFLVGEIISLSKPGGSPADAPPDFVTGFVEGITWSHVVIRDFKKKQVFIPLESFNSLTIHNWTRRPSKLCHWMLRTSSGDKDGTKIAMLARFVRQWIGAHDKIDHEGYTKAVVKANFDTGLGMEVVFYPKMGANRHQLCAEFVVTVMDASKRLNLTLIPCDIATPFPEQLASLGSTTAGTDNENLDSAKAVVDVIDDSLLEDLLPHEGLRKRAGYGPAHERGEDVTQI